MNGPTPMISNPAEHFSVCTARGAACTLRSFRAAALFPRRGRTRLLRRRLRADNPVRLYLNSVCVDGQSNEEHVVAALLRLKLASHGSDLRHTYRDLVEGQLQETRRSRSRPEERLAQLTSDYETEYAARSRS